MNARALRLVLALVFGLLVFPGCQSSRPVAARPFSFGQDTFAFANELVWEYEFDERGKGTARRREPKPSYTHHCFVLARASKQFFYHARFDPAAAPLSPVGLEDRVKEVLERSPTRVSGREPVVIPGFESLQHLSKEHPALLQEHAGGAWRSYLQRGHWRMVLPFSRRNQERAAAELAVLAATGAPVVVHVVRFPQLTINHALVVFAAKPVHDGMEFQVYDPNQPKGPVILQWNDHSREFHFPRNDYFAGGMVNIYEIYRNVCR